MAVERLELERFFELSYDMLCVLGYDGYYRSVNPAFERTLGFTEKELLSEPFASFVHPDDRDAAAADLQTLGDGIQTGVFEERHLHKDGSYRWLQWTAVSAGDGETCYALARDVTDRKRAEAELAESRGRIIDAADAARKRIERDLHDGAQQRLVSLMLKLRLIRSHVADPRAGAMLDELTEELRMALEELRNLARGIHPAGLTDFGLGMALQALSIHSPVPLEVRVDLDDRPPAPVEAAAYFVVAEAVTNVAKYADASRAVVDISRQGPQLVIVVADDGVGGADPGRGTGLRGLGDRVEVLGGTLALDSPPGAGTKLTARIPVSG